MAIASGNSRFTDALLAADGLASGYHVSNYAPESSTGDLGFTAQAKIGPLDNFASVAGTDASLKSQGPEVEMGADPSIQIDTAPLLRPSDRGNISAHDGIASHQNQRMQVAADGQAREIRAGIETNSLSLGGGEGTGVFNLAASSTLSGAATGAALSVLGVSPGVTKAVSAVTAGLDGVKLISDADIRATAKTQGVAAAHSMADSAKTAERQASDIMEVPKAAPAVDLAGTSFEIKGLKLDSSPDDFGHERASIEALAILDERTREIEAHMEEFRRKIGGDFTVSPGVIHDLGGDNDRARVEMINEAGLNPQEYVQEMDMSRIRLDMALS